MAPSDLCFNKTMAAATNASPFRPQSSPVPYDCLTPQMKKLRLPGPVMRPGSQTVRNRAATNGIPAFISPHAGDKEKEGAGECGGGDCQGYFENLAPGLESGLQIFSWPELSQPPCSPPRGDRCPEWSTRPWDSPATSVFKDLLLMGCPAGALLPHTSPPSPCPSSPRSLRCLGPGC